ncbi:MAG TPA: helix-turn-helix transcriptional regulator [Streptosporangiaceae bacterium]
MGRPERTLEPERSALDRFGYVLRKWRKRRGLSLARLGVHAHVSGGMIQLIEVAERAPTYDLARRCEAALDAGGEILRAWRDFAEPHDTADLSNTALAVNNSRAADDPPVSGVAAQQASKAMRPDQGRRVIGALDVIGSDQIESVADSLGDLVDHYALTIRAIPPASVYDELLSVRSYASGLIDRAGLAPRRKDLVLVTGWLSNLLAFAACDMGEHATARVWCSDAERRSENSGHPELAAWAVLTRAIIVFYQGRARQSLALAAQGQRIAPIGTVIHAKLASQEMRAAAMAGDADRMAQARSYAAKAIARLPTGTQTTGAFSVNLGEDPPYTATSLLFVGNFTQAVSATSRVLQTVYHPETRRLSEDPSGYARSLLILGLAQAGVGQLDAAVAAGQAALAVRRPAWPTMVLAGKLDHVLSRDFADARETAAYRDRYLEAASPSSGYHLPLSAPTAEN